MRLLLALGILGGATWIAYALIPAECVPVTAESEVFCNRLWTPALFGMTVGYLGLRRWGSVLGRPNVLRGFTAMVAGGVAMTFGNGAEYWLFFGWPHNGPDGLLRGVLWMTVLLGWLAVVLGSLVTGLLLVLARPGSLGTVGLGAVLVSTASFTVFVGPLALGLLAVSASLYVLIAGARAPREPAPEPA